jgi:flavin-dependent dehydrogenase
MRTPEAESPIVEIGAGSYRFYMADVTGMLQWMAEQAEGHGVVVRCGAMFQDAARDSDGMMRVTYTLAGAPTNETNDVGATDSDAAAADASADVADTSATAAPSARIDRIETVRARFLIGADGTRSRVAQRMDLDQNTRVLAGAEWLVENVTLDRETFYLIFDHKLAPGYCVWLAPHNDIVALGVAGRQREFKPNESLRIAQTLFGDVADLSQMRIVERKGGNIPVGGRLKRVARDDAKGRALLLGDAAGLCGAATGGGIYPALISGKLAAQAVANELLNGSHDAVKAYQRHLLQAGGLGPYLKVEDWIRFVLDRMGSNADLRTLLGIFASPQGQPILQSVLFETPIIGMDGNFLSMVRGFLGQHPSVYGAAIRMAWRRITARA